MDKKYILYYLKHGVEKYWQNGMSPYYRDCECSYNIKDARIFSEDEVDKVIEFLNSYGLYQINNIVFYKKEI